MNCIKNIIGDNRESPSKILLSYCIEIFKDREIIDYDKQVNDQSNADIANSSVFVGALEDAIQSANWEAVSEIMPKIYFVSDPRGTYMFWLDGINKFEEIKKYCPATSYWLGKRETKSVYLLPEAVASYVYKK